MPHVCDSDLSDARRYLAGASDAELQAFATRQLQARERYAQLLRFYRLHPCRVARIHLLTGSAVTLGRFCGLSECFDLIGQRLMPVDLTDAPASSAWAAYQRGCQTGLSWDQRDDLWMVAHLDDMDRVRAEHLDQAFLDEARTHAADPMWVFLKLHMEMTLGARLIDHLALAGQVPHETAVADGIATALTRIARTGWRLLARYAREGTRALITRNTEPSRELVSYRRTALQMLAFSFATWTAARVFRRGVRNRARGRIAEGPTDAWPLLAQVLGGEAGAVRQISPLIVTFYANPAQFEVEATLELHTTAARFWSFLVTTLIGQGLYEAGPKPIAARFRVFRRVDGSMHFVRELMVNTTVRTFDSDFLVREHRGTPTFFEVFPEQGVAIAMRLQSLPDGGLSIRGEELLLRGFRLPMFGVEVEFVSRAVSESELRIDGHLRLNPRTAWGRALAFGVLRRPRELGCIHYRVWRDS